jgi:hypothetical protein
MRKFNNEQDNMLSTNNQDQVKLLIKSRLLYFKSISLNIALGKYQQLQYMEIVMILVYIRSFYNRSLVVKLTN